MEIIQLFFILLHILLGNTSFFWLKLSSRQSFSIAVETHPSSAAWGFICCALTTITGSFHLRLSSHGAPHYCFKKYFFTTVVEGQEVITIFHWSCKRDSCVMTRKPMQKQWNNSGPPCRIYQAVGAVLVSSRPIPHSVHVTKLWYWQFQVPNPPLPVCQILLLSNAWNKVGNPIAAIRYDHIIKVYYSESTHSLK